MQKTVYNILVTDQVMHYFEKSSNLQKRRNHQTWQISLKRLIQLALKSPSFDYPIPFSRSVTNLQNKLFKYVVVKQLQQHQTVPHILLLL